MHAYFTDVFRRLVADGWNGVFFDRGYAALAGIDRHNYRIWDHQSSCTDNPVLPGATFADSFLQLLALARRRRTPGHHQLRRVTVRRIDTDATRPATRIVRRTPALVSDAARCVGYDRPGPERINRSDSSSRLASRIRCESTECARPSFRRENCGTDDVGSQAPTHERWRVLPLDSSQALRHPAGGQHRGTTAVPRPPDRATATAYIQISQAQRSGRQSTQSRSRRSASLIRVNGVSGGVGTPAACR